ncbi:MAG: nuclear transport factor 2 family protein [Dehalococcoidia bacterium]|nr:MAG: nuclear transport factor 2 family protein [Dehalococcoidia bacterium]
MTQQELEARVSTLEATIATLGARIRAVEDIEEIKKLMATYEDYLDSLQRLDELMALFTEDAKFVVSFAGDAGAEGVLLGTYEGKESIRRLLSQLNPTNLSYCAHLVTNAIITVDGEKAKGKWYLLCPFTALTPKGPVAVWEQGIYDNDFVKMDGKWMISLMRFDFNFSTPYEDGWAKTKMRGT